MPQMLRLGEAQSEAGVHYVNWQLLMSLGTANLPFCTSHKGGATQLSPNEADAYLDLNLCLFLSLSL